MLTDNQIGALEREAMDCLNYNVMHERGLRAVRIDTTILDEDRYDMHVVYERIPKELREGRKYGSPGVH